MAIDGFDVVFTMTDFYDGPRRGIAVYRNEPHSYESDFGDINGGNEVFTLRRVGSETLHIAMAEWTIWKRWETAFHLGEVTQDTHPALPEDRSEFERLNAELSQRLSSLAHGPHTKAHAEFRRIDEPSETGTGLEVRWRAIQE
jgi:hypothetical protein